MPVKEKTIVDLREEAVLLIEEGLSISAVARRYAVTRPTLYEWLKRYRNEGVKGLEDRSRAPHSNPRRTSESIEARLIEERVRWEFGSKKILQRLKEDEPSVEWPNRSTIDCIFKRNGLVPPRRIRRPPPKTPFARRYQAKEPGELSTIDFKGQFRLQNGKYCYPLAMVDYVSRYLLACDALDSTDLSGTWAVIKRVFQEHGLPRALHSDNGVPFGGHGNSRFSTLSVRLMKLDVQPVFSRPGQPQDNGAHERMNRTLKEKATLPPGRDRRDQQNKFDRFRQMFNEERPHEGIGMKRPARVYTPSPRAYPARQPKLHYDASFEVRKIGKNGVMKWAGKPIFIGQPFAGEFIGLVPLDYALWNVYFSRFLIGTFDEKNQVFN